MITITLTLNEAVHYFNLWMTKMGSGKVWGPADPDVATEIFEEMECGRSGAGFSPDELLSKHRALIQRLHRPGRWFYFSCDKEKWPPVFWLKEY